jgi:hypothetical protein
LFFVFSGGFGFAAATRLVEFWFAFLVLTVFHCLFGVAGEFFPQELA